MEIKKVGVVGCGIMGSGIAQVCAQSGYPTVVSEINDQLLKKGLGSIESFLAKGVERGRVTEAEKAAILGRLKGTTRLEDFRDCDLVVEAILEDMAEKKKVFAALDQICPKHAILASNTSCLSIIEMAIATKRPDKVLGLHFFNPVPIMKLLEMVKSIATSQETVDTARALGQSLGKTVVTAKDTPGFIVNRLLVPYLLDAIRLFEAGVASRDDIDQGMVLGCNHPMGPLALADFVGLDTLDFIARGMFDEFREPRFASPPLLRQMLRAGWLGRKTGKGFYDYK